MPGFATSGSASGTNTDFTVGFGVQVSILRNLAARAEWQKYNDVGGNNTGKTDIDVPSAPRSCTASSPRKKKGRARGPFFFCYATACCLNQASMRFQPSSAASLR